MSSIYMCVFTGPIWEGRGWEESFIGPSLNVWPVWIRHSCPCLFPWRRRKKTFFFLLSVSLAAGGCWEIFLLPVVLREIERKKELERRQRVVPTLHIYIHTLTCVYGTRKWRRRVYIYICVCVYTTAHVEWLKALVVVVRLWRESERGWPVLSAYHRCGVSSYTVALHNIEEKREKKSSFYLFSHKGRTRTCRSQVV